MFIGIQQNELPIWTATLVVRVRQKKLRLQPLQSSGVGGQVSTVGKVAFSQGANDSASRFT